MKSVNKTDYETRCTQEVEKQACCVLHKNWNVFLIRIGMCSLTLCMDLVPAVVKIYVPNMMMTTKILFHKV
jgi:hypothetical protein